MRAFGVRPSVVLMAVVIIGSAATPVAAGGAVTRAPATALRALALPAILPTVTRPAAFGVSKPVTELPRSEPPGKLPGFVEEHEDALIHSTGDGSFRAGDAAVQTGTGGSGIPPTSQNFEGTDVGESSSDGVFIGAPPDTNGDVGPNHYVQTVNTVFAIYSKTGERLVGPLPLDNLWQSAPNAAQFNCTTQSRGDPVVQYDPMANRWLITQFNFPGTAVIAPPFDECIAVSTTADPTGSYYLYDFRYSATIFNDYPHFGVWPDAYYMSVNQFDHANNDAFNSAGACAFERAKMLTGDPNARQVCFDESAFDPKDANGNFVYGGQLPADLDGVGYGSSFSGAPPAGAANAFMQMLDSTTAGADKLLLFRFHVDWSNPAASTFGDGTAAGNGRPITLSVADFSLLCNGDQTEEDRNCIPQAETDPSVDSLDSIGDRLMYRLAYRNLGDHESLLLNHTVNAGAGDAAGGHAGIRWYEVRDPNGRPSVYQQSTFAPDAAHRWMGSIAMDQSGNIALGYSKSSAAMHPAISYTGRLATDARNAMTLGEANVIEGTGSQSETGNRWGDYSSMSVDPDGCTFWFTSEYYAGGGTFNWNTRVGSFTLPSCGDPRLSLNASTANVRVRNDFSYTMAVTSGAKAARNATVSNVLPSGARLVSVSASRGTCSGTATVVCHLGDLPAGALETIRITVHTTGVGDLTDTATLATSSTDSNPANNAATVVTRVFDSCSTPGAVMATDPAGDQTGLPEADIQLVAVAEPWLANNTDALVFTLKVAKLDVVPPNTYWYEHFTYGGVNYFVSMETATDPTTPTFHYGRYDVDETSGLNTENPLGDAEGAFNADGTITMTLPTSVLTQNPNPTQPPNGNPPGPGAALANVHGETRALVGVLLTLVDTTAGGSYTLSGNDFCAPDRAPIAALSATPASGTAPLKVTLDASASSDPDNGDSIASYTFTFDDGSTPVTQSAPTIVHTYKDPGTYHAQVSVTDSRGLTSTDAATADVTVSAAPNADLSVTAAGPATARVGDTVTYTITVANGGPDAATGVTLTDTLPQNVEFKSASASQGACPTRPTNGAVTCSLGNLANGSSATVTVVVKPRKKGDLVDAARVAATSPNDPVSGNNTASVTTKVS